MPGVREQPLNSTEYKLEVLKWHHGDIHACQLLFERKALRQLNSGAIAAFLGVKKCSDTCQVACFRFPAS